MSDIPDSAVHWMEGVKIKTTLAGVVFMLACMAVVTYEVVTLVTLVKEDHRAMWTNYKMTIWCDRYQILNPDSKMPNPQTITTEQEETEALLEPHKKE